MKKKCTFKSILKIPALRSIRGEEPLVTLSATEHTTGFLQMTWFFKKKKKMLLLK